MKQIFYFLLGVAAFILFYSCSEDFSPKGDVPNKYSINLVLRGDTTVQFAYVSHVYDVPGFDPKVLATDPAVDGASISIKYADDNKIYYFRDTTDNTNINARYHTSSKYYYLNNFQPQYGRKIEMNVNLPNGQRLSSSTVVPENVNIDITKSTQIILTPPKIVQNPDTVYVHVYWTNSTLDNLKAKKVVIGYFHKDASGKKTWSIKPVAITSSGGVSLDYNNVSFTNDVQIERKLIDKALEEISSGDPAKARYYIAPLKVSILSLDDNLTKFYRSNLYFDYGFTILNYPGDFSNVTGGLGFFGSYSVITKMIHFDDQYLKNKFGYSVDSTYLTKPY